MPLYNKAPTVARSLTSVLAQSMGSFELLIVDDGSTDAGPEIVRKFGDGRLKVITQKNAGVSAARNAGIHAASANVIAFLDADDEWRPEFLSRICHLKARFADCAVYGTSYEIRRVGSSQRARLHGLPNGFSNGVLENYFTVAARSDPPLFASAVAVARTAIRDVGGFPLRIQSGEDLLTWAKLATKYKIAYSTEPLAIFWAPENAQERPGRAPAIPDTVGEELARLVTEYRAEGLQEYLAMWHRMRGATFLQLADAREARKELMKAARLGPLSTTLGALLAISLLPGPVARETYAKLRRAGSR